MGLIALEGMRFHAYHGFYAEEQSMGNDYIIDVHLTANTGLAAATDDLYQTINYETIYDICKIVMRQKAKLLETVVDRIVMKIRQQFMFVQGVKVVLRKVAPPLGGKVDYAIVENNNSASSIALEGMYFHAFHGFYDEEQKMGNDYALDVYVNANTALAAATDDLYQTVNYETIYDISKIVMSQKTRLLETIAERIIRGLKHQFGNIRHVKVRIRKVMPPIGGQTDFAIVEEEDSFMEQCGRCGQGIICYGDEYCKCKSTVVFPRTQEAILQQYKKCLCPNCLNFYAN